MHPLIWMSSLTAVNHGMYLLFHSSFWKLSVLVLTFSYSSFYLLCWCFGNGKIWIQATLMSFLKVPYCAIAPRIMSWHCNLADLGKQILFKLLITRNSCYHYLIKIFIKYFYVCASTISTSPWLFLKSSGVISRIHLHKELAEQWVPYLWCHSCTTWHWALPKVTAKGIKSVVVERMRINPLQCQSSTIHRCFLANNLFKLSPNWFCLIGISESNIFQHVWRIKQAEMLDGRSVLLTV